MDLQGKVVLVTGAGRGLGRAIADALAAAGCHVAVSDCAGAADAALAYRLSSGDDLETTAAAVRRRGRRAYVQPADVTAPGELAALAAGIERELGGLDIVVANAGIIAAAPVAGMEPDVMWDDVLIPAFAAMTGLPAAQVFDRFIRGATYLKREQTPEEIADAAVYLCRAENVTGTTLTVAGGGEVH